MKTKRQSWTFHGEEWQCFEESFLVELSQENQLQNIKRRKCRYWDRTYVVIYILSIY